MQSRRNFFHEVKAEQAQPSHAGLWLDKYLYEQLPKGSQVASDKQTPQQQLVEEVSNIRVSDVYKAYYRRWQESLRTYGVVCHEAKVDGRLVVGLGAESVIETSVHLHHTYGVPVIPGSALKGLAAHYAHQQLADPSWQKGGEAHEIVFGSTHSAGYIVFYDALYIPGSGQPLFPDVITVHHPVYYQQGSQDNIVPADWDDPNPVSFLSSTGKYLIALGSEGATVAWVNAAFHILQEALQHYRVGAKTSSGYGRLIFTAEETHQSNLGKSQQKSRIPPTGFERGRVKAFGLGDKKSYGFIIPDGGGKDVFVHRKYLVSGLHILQEGQYIYFRRVRNSDGEHAEDVQLE